jgi:GTPase Era involved in 16S rRNA processing
MDNSATRLPREKLAPLSQEHSRQADELGDLLGRLRGLCQEFGEGFPESLVRVAELQERLSAERFHLAVLGQFKRGKSTLLNALLGEPLLPTAVVPLTSIPTLLYAGKTRVVRVFFHGGRQAVFSDLPREQASEVLARHVTEKGNPGNQLEVAHVEVEHPSSLLSAGVVLIDTPGIGSTLRHNTEATLNFLPQCDAALFVVSADPPMTEVERDFLKAVRDKVAKLCFVMNKIDYLSEDELADTLVFLEKILKELDFPKTPPIFKVSARQGIAARVREDPRGWRESGLEQLQTYLFDFLSREKLRTLQTAIAKKAVAIVADTTLHISLQRCSLQLSHQEVKQRIAIFDDKVKEIEQEKIKLGDLLAGDKKRTVELLENLAQTLRTDARRHLAGVATQALQEDENPAMMEPLARDRIAEEIPIFFAAKLTAFSNAVNDALRKALLPYQERLDEMLSTLRSTAAELFEIPYRATISNGRLEELHRPYWVTQKWNTSMSPVPEGFLDRFLPTELRKHRLQKRLHEEVETLVTRNVENIRWATLRNLEDAFCRVSSALGEQLKETAEATRLAMSAARLRHKQDEETTEPEILRLGQKITELEDLENTLSQHAQSIVVTGVA